MFINCKSVLLKQYVLGNISLPPLTTSNKKSKEMFKQIKLFLCKSI